MYAALSLLALVGCVAATPAYLIAGAYDDGQWHPELDGSIIGSGAFRWGLDDGSWKPELDGSVLGSGDLTWLSRRKRDLVAVNPNTLSHPLDEPVTALAKQAQLIQQNTEATRNLLGGGIPLALPADTPEVAAGKQAHAIAHENQKLATSGLYAPLAASYAAPLAASYATPLAASYATPLAASYAAPLAVPYAARIAPIASSIYPYGVAATPYYANPYGLHGLRTLY